MADNEVLKFALDAEKYSNGQNIKTRDEKIAALGIELKTKDNDLNIIAKALGKIYAERLYNIIKSIIKNKDEKVK
jgi:hypothetical protein